MSASSRIWGTCLSR